MNPPEEKFVVDLPPEETQSESPSASSFSIVPHLLVIGGILFLIFSTIIIPRTLSFLLPKDQPVETPTNTPVNETSEATPVFTLAANQVAADAVHVYDLKTGQTLYEKNANTALPLASITKLMTTLVAYELVPNETPITISRAAALQQSGGTLTWGEEFTVKELADFALLSSYNSAAYALASAVGAELGDKDPTEQFIAGMNIKAEELQLSTLKFLNPTGLDISATEAGAYGSAKDVSHLVGYIYTTYPEILSATTISGMRLYNTSGTHHDGENTNESFGRIPNLLGSKTGYTDLAGGNLTVIFDAGFNHPIVITVLGSSRTKRFSDVETLVAKVLETIPR